MEDVVVVHFVVPLWVLRSIAAVLVTALLFLCWEGFNAPPIPEEDE